MRVICSRAGTKEEPGSSKVSSLLIISKRSFYQCYKKIITNFLYYDIRPPLAVYVIKPNHRATTVITTILHGSLVKYLQLLSERATLKIKLLIIVHDRLHKSLNKDCTFQLYQSNHYKGKLTK